MAKTDNFFVKNKSLLTFLILEVVALTAFNFGNASYLFGIAGALLAVGGIVFILNVEKDKKSLLTLVAPVVLLFIVSAIGSFNKFSEGMPPLLNIALLVSLPAFLTIGFFLRRLNDVKTKTVLLVIGAAFAALCLFGLFSTIFEYGVFYTIIYKNTPHYYYNGELYNITEEMYWLNGFEFGEVYTEYGSLFAILSAAYLPGLLFISPKKERNDFIICAAIGGVGLITLLIIPNFNAIIILIIASLFAAVMRFLRNNKKALKILGISFVSLVGLGVLFYILTIVNAAIGFTLPSRIFVQNKIMATTEPILEALFYKDASGLVNFFGLSPYFSKVLATQSHIFEIELLKEVGLIGAFIFLGFLGYIGYLFYKYLKNSKDEVVHKSLLIGLVLTFFLYETLFNVVLSAPHYDGYDAFLKSPVLLVILFVIGYIIADSGKKEEEHE